MIKIKTNEALYDISGDNPDFFVPCDTILIVESTEDGYWIARYNGGSFIVIFEEGTRLDNMADNSHVGNEYN